MLWRFAAWRIPNVFLPQVSNTFHGRDHFCSCGSMACGERENFRELGPELAGFSTDGLAEPDSRARGLEDGGDSCGYLWKRHHGISSSAKRTACSPCCSRTGKRIPFERFYAAVPRGNPLAVIGSSGFVEIAINMAMRPENWDCAPGASDHRVRTISRTSYHGGLFLASLTRFPRFQKRPACCARS